MSPQAFLDRISGRIFFLVPLLTLTFLTGSPAGAACLAPTPAPSFRVEPARTPRPNDPLKIAVVLLGDYLSFVKKPKEDAVIRLDVAAESGRNYRLIALHGEKRIESPFVFPDTLNDALIGLTGTIAQDVKKPLKEKKVLPFRNETPSDAAFLRYADGRTALESSDWTGAVAAFEDALQSDYNYVEAYAGLAEAQAALGATSASAPMRLKAKATLQKAKLLNPYRAKRHEERAEWYLKTGCGGNNG